MANPQLTEVPSADRVPVFDKQHIKLSIIINYYLNQSSYEAVWGLLSDYEAYPNDLLDVIQFVLVDDCSPLTFDIPDYNLNITWLRINEDIPWNIAGARNLGVVYAKSDKILLSDMDIIFPEATLRKLVSKRPPGKSFYKFRCLEPSGEPAWMTRRNSHPNLFFMSRARFLRLYGYDEEFAGGYGFEERRFWRFHRYHGTWPRVMAKKYHCIHRASIDRSQGYHSLNRDHTRNRPIERRKGGELDHWGAEAGHSRLFLNFTWKVVKQHHRDNRIPRKVDKWWKRRWWFRTLFASYR